MTPGSGLWISVAGGTIAGVAYVTASGLLYYLLRQKRFRHRRLGFLVSALLFVYGTAHLLSVLSIWYPLHAAEAAAKSLAAILSIAAAAVFLPLLPKVLALPSPSALARANALLEQEIAVRRAAEEELRRAQAELEVRVQDRTADLFAANQRLEREIRERRHIQDSLYRAIEEREALLREVHHRVKNNLQMMTSFLSLQIRGESSEPMRQKLREMQARISALSIVHKNLYGGTDIAQVDVGGMLSELVKQLGAAYRIDKDRIRLEVNAESLCTDMDHAIPLALLTTEAVTNALKHAFPDGRTGSVRVELVTEGTSAILRIADDGVGWPGGITPDAPAPASGALGITLMRGMARQLDGRFRLGGRDGVEVRVVMKAESLAKPGMRNTA